MSEEEIFEKMDDYLMGKLAPEAAKAFEADLAGHPEWQDELNLLRIEHEGMELLMEDKLRADMRRWDEAKPAPKKGKNRWLLLVLVLLLCAVALVFLWEKTTAPAISPSSSPTLDSLQNDTQPLENQTLPINKINPPIAGDNGPAPPIHTPSPIINPVAFAEKSVSDLDVGLGTRGDEDDKTLALADSLDAALAAKDYRLLLRLTEKPQGPLAPTLRYIRGWAFFKLRNFDEAETIFEKLVSENNTRLNVKAQRMLMYSLLAQFPEEEKALEKLLDGFWGEANHPLKPEAERVKEAIH